MFTNGVTEALPRRQDDRESTVEKLLTSGSHDTSTLGVVQRDITLPFLLSKFVVTVFLPPFVFYKKPPIDLDIKLKGDVSDIRELISPKRHK